MIRKQYSLQSHIAHCAPHVSPGRLQGGLPSQTTGERIHAPFKCNYALLYDTPGTQPTKFPYKYQQGHRKAEASRSSLAEPKRLADKEHDLQAKSVSDMVRPMQCPARTSQAFESRLYAYPLAFARMGNHKMRPAGNPDSTDQHISFLTRP